MRFRITQLVAGVVITIAALIALHFETPFAGWVLIVGLLATVCA